MRAAFAYDMDGVLARSPPPAARPWGRMNGNERAARRAELLAWYRQAPALAFVPPQKRFAVISARKSDPAIRLATQNWLERRYPGRVVALHLLAEGRTIRNVVAFKAGVIAREGYTDFVEDNREVVRGVALALPDCRVWLFEDCRVTRWAGSTKRPGAISRP